MRNDRFVSVLPDDMLRDPVAAVACAEHDPANAVREDMVDDEVQKRAAVDLSHRFGTILQNRPEPGPQASAENDCVGRCVTHQAASFFHVWTVCSSSSDELGTSCQNGTRLTGASC